MIKRRRLIECFEVFGWTLILVSSLAYFAGFSSERQWALAFGAASAAGAVAYVRGRLA